MKEDRQCIHRQVLSSRSTFAFNVLSTDQRTAVAHPHGAYDSGQQMWVGHDAATAGSYVPCSSPTIIWRCWSRVNEVGIVQNARSLCENRVSSCLRVCNRCTRATDPETGIAKWCMRGTCGACTRNCGEPTPSLWL